MSKKPEIQRREHHNQKGEEVRGGGVAYREKKPRSRGLSREKTGEDLNKEELGSSHR